MDQTQTHWQLGNRQSGSCRSKYKQEQETLLWQVWTGEGANVISTEVRVLARGNTHTSFKGDINERKLNHLWFAFRKSLENTIIFRVYTSAAADGRLYLPLFHLDMHSTTWNWLSNEMRHEDNVVDTYPVDTTCPF